MAERGALLDFSWIRDTSSVTEAAYLRPAKVARLNIPTVENRFPLPTAPLPSLPSAPGNLHLNLLGGIPMSAMPGEGRRRWGSVAVDDATYVTAEELLLEGRPSAAAQLSLFRAFDRWRATNRNLPRSPGEILAIFGAYLFEHDLKASTCANYVRTAWFFLRRLESSHPEPQWYLALDILRGLDRHASRQPRDHAIDIDEARALHILSTIQAVDVAFVIWLMCVCGARVADIRRLAPEQVQLRGSRIVIHFRETKTVVRPIDQYSVDLDLWIPFKEEWRPYLVGRLSAPNCDRVNYVLHSAGFEETSYSFRRLFINRVIHRFTEGGITDWLRVIELTGHRKAATAKGLYKQHLLDFTWTA